MSCLACAVCTVHVFSLLWQHFVYTVCVWRAFAYRNRAHRLPIVIQQSHIVALMNTTYFTKIFIFTKVLNRRILNGVHVCVCVDGRQWNGMSWISLRVPREIERDPCIENPKKRVSSSLTLCRFVYLCACIYIYLWIKSQQLCVRARNRKQVYYYVFVTTATIVIDGNVLSGWIIIRVFFSHFHSSFHFVIITSKTPSTCSDSWFLGIIILAFVACVCVCVSVYCVCLKMHHSLIYYTYVI